MSVDQYSLRQRRGFFILLILAGGCLLSTQLWRCYQINQIEVDTVDYLALRQWVADLQDSLGAKDVQIGHGLEAMDLPLEDLNQATGLELQRVHGIGQVLARRIVIARETLGGFHSWSQLAEIQSLNAQKIKRLAQRFQISNPPRLLQINRLDQASLTAHPYVGETLALRIVKHRPFADLEDFQSQTGISDELLTRLKPYLSYVH